MIFKQKVDTSLIELLIKYNFAFIRTNNNKKGYNSSIKKTFTFQSSLGKEFIQVTDLSQLLKSMKQFTRLLLFLRRSINSRLVVGTASNNYLFSLLKVFLSTAQKIKFKEIVVENSFFTSNLDKNIQNLYIKLSDSIQNKIYENLFKSRRLLIQEINSNINYNNPGVYKIFNTLDDWKKTIFFIILIKKIYLKK
jgi:hypothetical protein